MQNAVKAKGSKNQVHSKRSDSIYVYANQNLGLNQVPTKLKVSSLGVGYKTEEMRSFTMLPWKVVLEWNGNYEGKFFEKNLPILLKNTCISLTYVFMWTTMSRQTKSLRSLLWCQSNGSHLIFMVEQKERTP